MSNKNRIIGLSICFVLVLLSGIQFEEAKDKMVKISVYTRLFNYLKNEETPDLRKFEDELEIEYEKNKKYVIKRLNCLAYKMIHYNRPGDAVLVLKIGIVLSPDDANLYDSLGKAYMESGNNSSAIKCYEKSLKLNPKNTNAEKMLKKLLEESPCSECGKC